MEDCEFCAFYYIDEDGDATCEVELDEDEYARFLSDRSRRCPYFQKGGDAGDYEIVRHQM